VLVASGEVDMAIGCDQGGSIRVPSSFCGAYGMKPTHGLVPYSGILPIEPTIDHAGPITRSVRDNALLLEVIAGPDGYDPRQYAPIVHAYVDALEGGVAGMKIGLFKEGFGLPMSEPDVDAAVRAAADRFTQLGARVDEVSIPLHHTAGALCGAITVEGMVQTFVRGDGFGSGRNVLYVTSLMDVQRNWRARANDLAETVKVAVLLGSYIERQHGHHYYAKAMRLVRRVTAAYDAVLAQYDLLLMPTTPMQATPLPGPQATREEIVQRAFEPIANTAPFNVTHHPAMSIPCGMRHGLPVGMMLVGRHYDEPSIYRAAFAFEQTANWMAV
jgi:amidase